MAIYAQTKQDYRVSNGAFSSFHLACWMEPLLAGLQKSRLTQEDT
jgi:hypothetical protein